MSSVTVVVLTYNRVAEVAQSVERLNALPERPAIIVVDNASSDGTAKTLARAFPDVEVVRLPGNIGAAGRNAGAERARTLFVAFSDDDTWWAPGSLARAVEILERHPRLAAVTAQVLVGPERRIDPVSREMAASPLGRDGLPGPRLLGFLAGASVFRRSAFIEAGGYEPRLFIGAEEKLLAYELAARGWSLAYVPELTVYHHPSVARDHAARSTLLARNELWIAWLRRPLRTALAQALRTPPRALARALAGLPWIVRERRLLPAQVEALCARLERKSAPDPDFQALRRRSP
jgi:GT2 family glycosyltransferase